MTLLTIRCAAQPVPFSLAAALIGICGLAYFSTFEKVEASERDEYGGWTQVQGRKTGFFHVEEVRGRWWFITPGGNVFFSKGINSAHLTDGDEENAGKATADGAARWVESAAKLLRECGLNTAGCWSAPELGAHGVAYCFKPHLSGTHKGEWPDVFDPKWVEQVKQRAADQCGKLKSDPWLIGYFTDNELRWEHEDKAPEVLKQFLAMPAGSPGRQKAESFEKKPGKTAADEFRQEVAIAYFRATAEAIRAADSNHLILGCRFAGHPPLSVVRAMKGYADVISLNNYSAKAPVTLLHDMHAAAGLPVMVTEWSVKGKDSGALTAHGSGPVVATQRERAAEYEKYVKELAGLSYCVGFHWFRYRDHPGSNQGLLKTNDQPWTELMAAFKSLNPTLDERHAH